MPEEKRPLKVFLSHAHSDAKAVRALYDRLTADGIDMCVEDIINIKDIVNLKV